MTNFGTFIAKLLYMTSKKLNFRFKKRYVVFFLVFSYIIICQACMTMRMTKKETQVYFDKSNTEFKEETVDIEDYKMHYIQTGNPDNPTLLFVHGSPGSWDAF
jgi:hypothetical protein